MSYNWDNVTWQSKDRSWNRGFFKRISMADHPGAWEDPDAGYDPEWDDDFDHSHFALVNTGFATEEEANDSSGPCGNPGWSTSMKYWGNAKACQALDKLAAKADKIDSPATRRRNRYAW